MTTNDGELASFLLMGTQFPSFLVCLFDTYDTIKSGIRNAILAALALQKAGYTKGCGLR